MKTSVISTLILAFSSVLVTANPLIEPRQADGCLTSCRAKCDGENRFRAQTVKCKDANTFSECNCGAIKGGQ
ncbi:hypothetical protein LZ31DRAFT_390728 [Colletotrichum somersetense]|nr:hypothetical protein LZ31DRAFT_390728 [Colletotrichum somersetense]